VLDRIGTVRLVDDMRRRRRAWIAAGQRLAVLAGALTEMFRAGVPG
jgi:hypothetical protein